MSDDMFAENMVCATVNAPHTAMSDTLLAYLIAHRPDRMLAFGFSTQNATTSGHWKDRLAPDVRICADADQTKAFVGVADVSTWSRIFRENGPAMERDRVEIIPMRPGAFKGRKA